MVSIYIYVPLEDDNVVVLTHLGFSGELVCFFRAPPRFVGSVLRGLTDSPAMHGNEAELPSLSTHPSSSSNPSVATPQNSNSNSLSNLASNSMPTATSVPQPPPRGRPKKPIYQPPSFVFDAVKRLSAAAKDKQVVVKTSSTKSHGTAGGGTMVVGQHGHQDSEQQLVRVMTDFLTHSKGDALPGGGRVAALKGTMSTTETENGFDADGKL